MESGLRDRNNSTREILTRLNDWVSMESGLRDRNNREGTNGSRTR